MTTSRLFLINGQFQPLTVNVAILILRRDFGFTQDDVYKLRTYEAVIEEAEVGLEILGIPSITAYEV